MIKLDFFILSGFEFSLLKRVRSRIHFTPEIRL